MLREKIKPRPGWEKRLEDLGFTFHSMGGVYWNESACYSFSASEIDEIETASRELHKMCIEAAGYVISNDLFGKMAIPESFRQRIIDSWEDDEPYLYGRFDFSYDGTGPPKLLEYNADTPTALLEASVAQWFWLEDVRNGMDQFNSIHEKLIDEWKYILTRLPEPVIHFACAGDSDEDFRTVEYLRDTAMQAGFETSQINMEDIGWDSEKLVFVDLDDRRIHNLFKLYPWEIMIREEFGLHLLHDSMRIIEPYWKMLFSNKGILPILWELFPGHPNLLPAYFEKGRIEGSYVKKPLLSREGANIEIVTKYGITKQEGVYGNEGFVYQGYAPLPVFDDTIHAVIGSWIIGGEPAGIGIREDDSIITKNTSRFVPHYFIPRSIK